MAGLSEIWVAEGASDPPAPPPPQSSLLTCPFLLMRPLNMLFLKEVTKMYMKTNKHNYEQVKIKLNT